MQQRRLTVRRIAKEIKASIPDDYSIEEKIAYIVSEFSKKIATSEHYYFGNEETKQKMIELAQKPYFGKKNDIKRTLIPFTMSEKLALVLRQCGHRVEFVKRIPGTQNSKKGKNWILKEPATDFVDRELSVLVEGNPKGKKIEVNCFSDLYRIQTRCSPMLFGKNTHCDTTKETNSISREFIAKIFKKVYGLSDNEKFTDEYIDGVVERRKKEGKSPCEILNELLKDERIQYETQNAGCVEAYRFYQMIIQRIYCKGFGVEQWNAQTSAKEHEFELDKDATVIDECVLNDKNKKRYSFCIYAEHGDEQVFFVYSKKARKMVELSQKEIAALLERDSRIILGQSKCEKMQSYIGGVKKSPIIQQNQTLIHVDDIFGKEDEER